MRPVRILSTKKLKANQKQFLLNAGFSVIEADFISIKNKDFAFSNIKDNLVFTSQNAVKAVSNRPGVQEIRRKPAFCVGERTAGLLDASGFTVQEWAEGASELAKIAVSGYASESFTWFCGNIRRDELPAALSSAGVDFNEIEVYETVLAPLKIESEVDGILFFSPSAVEGFLCENKLEGQHCFCIGKTTAGHLLKVAGLDPDKVTIANQPTIESTIAKCVNHFSRKPEVGSQKD